MPWFKHPIRLLDSDESRHLAHLLRAAGDPSPEDASRSVVGLLWELAARSPTPGTIATPEQVIECALRKPGAVPMLVASGLAVQDDAGLHVVYFAEWNQGQAAKAEGDRERRRKERADGKASARVARPSRDRPSTVAGPSREGRAPDADADADADADEEQNSSAPASSASPVAAHSGSSVPCGAAAPLTSTQSTARAERDAPRATTIFDDMTNEGPQTSQDAPADPEETTRAPVAAKRAKGPRKRADGTEPDGRIPIVIRGWESAYLERCRIAAPKLSPEAAGSEFAAIGKLIRRIDLSMTGADIVGLLDHALMLAQGSDYEASRWRGLSLRALLADVSVAKLRLSKAAHDRANGDSWSRIG
jgi:hypothetical protein